MCSYNPLNRQQEPLSLPCCLCVSLLSAAAWICGLWDSALGAGSSLARGLNLVSGRGVAVICNASGFPPTNSSRRKDQSQLENSLEWRARGSQSALVLSPDPWNGKQRHL